MSLLPAKTKGEGIWQYCNYGYDHNKYSSYADCMDKRCKEAGLGGGGLFGCKSESTTTNYIEGCTDETADNYNINATFDDASCTYDALPEDDVLQNPQSLQAGERCSDFRWGTQRGGPRCPVDCSGNPLQSLLEKQKSGGGRCRSGSSITYLEEKTGLSKMMMAAIAVGLYIILKK